MLYLRSWLEDYIDLKKYSDSELSDIISLKSGEVDIFFEISDWFNGKVKVGKITNSRPHPDADRLTMFDIDFGAGDKLQIISAAQNVRDGLIVPVGTIGTKFPFFTVVERKMRGISSFGICLGKSELMLETEKSEGLWELNDLLSAKGNSDDFLGLSICEVLPEFFPAQTIFDIKFLQDKIGTCGSHVGLSLEIAYCLQDYSLLKSKAQRLLQPNLFWNEFQDKVVNIARAKNSLSFEDKTGYTNSFFGFELDLNTQNLQDYTYNLPHELQLRMFLTENNLVGGIVDLSNYLLFDTGQPSHFFSQTKLNTLVGENSNSWKIEKLTQATKFNGLGQLKSIVIPEGVEVIKSGDEVLGIPGISGGESTKTNESDTKVIVEIANFRPEKTANSSFALNHRSEGARFWNSGVVITTKMVWLLNFLDVLEQNINHDQIKLEYNCTWLNRHSDLFVHISEDENLLETFRNIFELSNTIEIDFKQMQSRLDNVCDEGKITDNLSLLGKIEQDTLVCNKFYNNFKTQEDLLFELSKIIGFENLQPEYLFISNNQIKNNNHKKIDFIKDVFVSFGFSEIISRPFLANNHVVDLGNNQQFLQALNSQSQNQSNLRHNLLSSLLITTSANIQRAEKNIKIFEFGKVYSTSEDGLTESQFIEGILSSEDPYTFTTIVNILKVKTGSDYTLSEIDISQAGKGWQYSFENGLDVKIVEISNKIKKQFDIPLTKKLFYLSINLTDWDYKLNFYNQYFDESDFSKIKRSYSIIAPLAVKWLDIQSLLASKNIDTVNILITPSERISTDSEIINYEVEFTPLLNNLSSETISQWEDSMYQDLEERFGIVRR